MCRGALLVTIIVDVIKLSKLGQQKKDIEGVVESGSLPQPGSPLEKYHDVS